MATASRRGACQQYTSWARQCRGLTAWPVLGGMLLRACYRRRSRMASACVAANEWPVRRQTIRAMCMMQRVGEDLLPGLELTAEEGVEDGDDDRAKQRGDDAHALDGKVK